MNTKTRPAYVEKPFGTFDQKLFDRYALRLETSDDEFKETFGTAFFIATRESADEALAHHTALTRSGKLPAPTGFMISMERVVRDAWWIRNNSQHMPEGVNWLAFADAIEYDELMQLAHSCNAQARTIRKQYSAK